MSGMDAYEGGLVGPPLDENDRSAVDREGVFDLAQQRDQLTHYVATRNHPWDSTETVRLFEAAVRRDALAAVEAQRAVNVEAGADIAEALRTALRFIEQIPGLTLPADGHVDTETWWALLDEHDRIAREGGG